VVPPKTRREASMTPSGVAAAITASTSPRAAAAKTRFTVFTFSCDIARRVWRLGVGVVAGREQSHRTQ
jgi:hypothetical protein